MNKAGWDAGGEAGRRSASAVEPGTALDIEVPGKVKKIAQSHSFAPPNGRLIKFQMASAAE